MATTGVTWCLILITCLSLVVYNTAVLTQTYPPYSPVCPHDRLVLTCVFHGTGDVYWRIDINHPYTGVFNGSVRLLGSFLISTTSNSTTTVITATNESIPLSTNGVTVGCINSSLEANLYTINIAGPPDSIYNNAVIVPISNDMLLINWNASGSCIDYYNVTIISNNMHKESSVTNDTNITINSLIIGTNYSFIIIPIDIIGREGPPSSLIQFLWNVPVQVVNISWYQISNDTVTIWWNNEDTITLRPPIEYYIINVYITTICINSCSVYSYNVTDTIITITELSPINEYYTVTIIPVNVIGYGPSVTVNVSITTTTVSSITNSMMSTTDFITTQDKSSVMTTIITITETISSCADSYDSIVTTTTCMLQSTNIGSISVAIAVPITGLLTGLITAIITSIIVCLIMKKRGTTIQNKTLVGGGGEAVIGPIYDLPTINTEQQEQIIDTKLNTAYGQTIM